MWCSRVGKAIALDAEGAGFYFQRRRKNVQKPFRIFFALLVPSLGAVTLFFYLYFKVVADADTIGSRHEVAD